MIRGAEEMSARLRDLTDVAPGVELVVLVDSTLIGRGSARSDVSLALRADSGADLDELYRLLTPRLQMDHVSLVDLRRASPILMMAVARSGRLIYEQRPGVYRQFQSLASRRYCDTAKLRRAQRRAIAVFLERHGLAIRHHTP